MNRTIEFESVKFQIRQEFGEFVLSRSEINVENNMLGMVIAMRTYILGQHNYQEYTVKHQIPANWWECFKEEHMPKWFIKRYPVKKKYIKQTVTFDHKKLFPKAEYIPEGMGPVIFHSHSDDSNVIRKYE